MRPLYCATLSTGTSTFTTPAFSNISSIDTIPPCFSGAFNPDNMTWVPPVFRSTVAPAPITRPPSIIRIFITSFTMVVWWIMAAAAAGVEIESKRSSDVPLLVIDR
jgi:hypothetical protein